MKSETKSETKKHSLIGWAFLSKHAIDKVGWQGEIVDVIATNSRVGDIAICDLHSWIMGEYTHSVAIPLSRFVDMLEEDGTNEFELFKNPEDRNDYYDHKYRRK
jgi:hypothetical protein